MAIRSVQGQQAFAAVEQLTPDEQQEVVAAVLTANPSLIPVEDKNKTKLWLMLLGGLMLLALVSVIGYIILAVEDEEGTAVIAIASAVVAGVIGLFSNPPTGK